MQSHHMLTADLEVDGTVPLFRTRQYRLEWPKVTQMIDGRAEIKIQIWTLLLRIPLFTKTRTRITFKDKKANRFTSQP